MMTLHNYLGIYFRLASYIIDFNNILTSSNGISSIDTNQRMQSRQMTAMCTVTYVITRQKQLISSRQPVKFKMIMATSMKLITHARKSSVTIVTHTER